MVRKVCLYKLLKKLTKPSRFFFDNKSKNLIHRIVRGNKLVPKHLTMTLSEILANKDKLSIHRMVELEKNKKSIKTPIIAKPCDLVKNMKPNNIPFRERYETIDF